MLLQMVQVNLEVGDPANGDDGPNAPDESGTIAPRGKLFCPLKAGPRDGIAEVEGGNDDSGA